jgi:hypothetical protein
MWRWTLASPLHKRDEVVEEDRVEEYILGGFPPPRYRTTESFCVHVLRDKWLALYYLSKTLNLFRSKGCSVHSVERSADRNRKDVRRS